MCGIFFLKNKNNINDEQKSKCIDAIKLLNHRGPDNSEIIFRNKFAVGHTRLSIIDLSEKSNQPFFDEEHNTFFVINGEVVNYKLLAKKYNFKENEYGSDSDLVFKLFNKYGLTKIINELEGMFAGVFIDNRIQKAYIFRDRFGIKPLYYFKTNDLFLIASEINAILPFKTQREQNISVVRDFIIDGNIDHTSNTFFKDIQQLNAGCFFELDLTNHKLKKSRWYETKFIFSNQKLNKNYATDILLDILKELLDQYFISDVPLAINLSEGIDSSLLAYLSQSLGKSPYAYSIKYGLKNLDKFYNIQEFKFNRKFIEYNHISFIEHAKDVIRHQGQPFTGLFTVAYSLLYQQSKFDGFKVHLDGNGLDEIFLGYDKYFKIQDQNLNKSISGDKNINYNFYSKYLYSINSCLGINKIFSKFPEEKNFSRRLSLIDLFYLKIPRVLRFNDHVSMQHSCELRVPFLDHRLLNFAYNLPNNLLINNEIKIGKLIIRDLISKYTGKEFAFSKKRYVQTNQTKLLFNELYQLLKNSLLTDRFFSRNVVEPEKFIQHINNLREKDIKNSYYLWRLLSYEWWCQQFID